MKITSLGKFFILLATLVFTGCGGGGSSSTTTPEPTPPVDINPEPTVLTVTAVDGYLQNARIYIDLNENYMFDEVEPSGMSDTAGQVTFTLTEVAEGLIKPIIVEAIEGQTIDISTGLPVAKSYSMVAPPASEVVSPLTTLAQLSLVHTQQADIESAVATIKTQLGLPADADIMADYLSTTDGNESLYAIARSIVQLLPENAATLFSGQVDSETINTLMTTAGNIATAINDAIAAGAMPGAIFITLHENGSATATELTMEHAMAFIEDVQVWSDAFTLDFIQASSQFTNQVQAAAQLAQADTSELFSMLARYSEGGLLAVKANLFREMDAGVFVSGSTGTVTTSRNNETGVETIVIDAMLDDKSVAATITLSSEEATKATLTATMDSNTVTIMVSEGSELVLDGDTYIPLRLALNTTMDPKADSGALHFVGMALLDTVSLSKSDGESVIALSEMALSGLFDVDGQESFSAALHIRLNSTLVDDQLHIEVLTITLQLDADFANVPDAYLILDVSLGGQSDVLSLVLGYGDRKITITFASTNDVSEVVVTNAMGMTLTLDLTLQQNADNRGVLVMGIEQIATVSTVDGHYVVTFTNGTSITLF